MYNGPERRQSDPWRESIEEDIAEIREHQKCMRKNFDAFNTTYGPVLADILEIKARRDKLWAAAVEKLVVGGIWAALVFVGVALWHEFIGKVRFP